MTDYIPCISCGELFEEDQLIDFCCTSCNKRLNPIKTSFKINNVDLDPKYEYIYGKLYEHYKNIIAGKTLFMPGREFEFFCADILLLDGFNDITVTQSSSDNGIDIVAYKDNKKYVVQCKCLSGTCGNQAVQEVIAGNTIYNAEYKIVMCNRMFSISARQLANRNNVELYNGGRIKHILDLYFAFKEH
jgi:hypothetical protein